MPDPYKEPIDDKDMQDTVTSPPVSSVSPAPPSPPPAASPQPPPPAAPPVQTPLATPPSPTSASAAPPVPSTAPQPNFRPDTYREPIEAVPPAAVRIETLVAPEKIEKVEKIAEMPAKAPPEQPAKPETIIPAQVVQPRPKISESPPATDLDQDRQLKILIDLAFEQGISKAIEAANASGNAYLIDKFHDTLVDELRQQLIEKGKLKEV